MTTPDLPISTEVVPTIGIRPACPTCEGPTRETVDMVCPTCGFDYGHDPSTSSGFPGSEDAMKGRTD